MEIHVTDTIRFPRVLVFETYRDCLAELAQYLPNIDRIEVLEREEKSADEVRLLNLWKASATEIPTAVRAFVKPEMLQWHDHATWARDSFTCMWRNEVGFLKEAITVSGKNTFLEDGPDRTTIQIRGQLLVDAKKIPGVPRLLAGSVGPAVEKFVVNMITPNLREVNRGLEKYLQARGGV